MSYNRKKYLELWKELNEAPEESIEPPKKSDETTEPVADVIAEETPVEATEPEAVEEKEEPTPAPVLDALGAVDFSKKVISILENKVKLHNSRHDNQVTIDKLKEVYMNGSGDYELVDETVVVGWKNRLLIKSDWPVWAMARVNMFLRMLRKEKTGAKDSGKSVVASTDIDTTVNLLPGEDNFEEAVSDMEGVKAEDGMVPEDIYLDSIEKIKSFAIEFHNKHV